MKRQFMDDNTHMTSAPPTRSLDDLEEILKITTRSRANLKPRTSAFSPRSRASPSSSKKKTASWK